MNTPFVPPDDAGPEGIEPPSAEVLAGEFVLGVLDATQRREAQARIGSDSAFAQRVEVWERRLAPLLTDIAPVAVPARVWTGICRRLGFPQPEVAPSGFWQSLGFWRATAMLASLVAVVAIVFSIERALTVAPVPVARQAEPGAKPVTPLARADGTPGWLAAVDAVRGTVLMVPVPSAPDAQGRVPELWLIPAGQAPRSLGVVSTRMPHPGGGPADIRAAVVPGSVLAITLEPAAGVPHPAPSGAVIAKGTIQPLPATS